MADYDMYIEEKLEKEKELLRNIKSRTSELENLSKRVNSHWGYEDLVYRFYHQSNKVYQIQKITQEIITLLKELLPSRNLCEIDLLAFFEFLCHLSPHLSQDSAHYYSRSSLAIAFPPHQDAVTKLEASYTASTTADHTFYIENQNRIRIWSNFLPTKDHLRMDKQCLRSPLR